MDRRIDTCLRCGYAHECPPKSKAMYQPGKHAPSQCQGPQCTNVADAPMLTPEVWYGELKQQSKSLRCIECVEKQLGRMLTVHDLLRSPVNQFSFLLFDRASALLEKAIKVYE